MHKYIAIAYDDMRNYRLYTRPLSDQKLAAYRKAYQDHLGETGFLTKDQKQRILGLKSKEYGTSDADFWYRIRHKARCSILDLDLLSRLASENDVNEIFRSLSEEQCIDIRVAAGNNVLKDFDKKYYPNVHGKYKRTDLPLIIGSVLRSNEVGFAIDLDNWRDRLVIELMKVCLNYIQKKTVFQNTVHETLFQDIKSSLGIEPSKDQHRHLAVAALQ